MYRSCRCPPRGYRAEYYSQWEQNERLVFGEWLGSRSWSCEGRMARTRTRGACLVYRMSYVVSRESSRIIQSCFENQVIGAFAFVAVVMTAVAGIVGLPVLRIADGLESTGAETDVVFALDEIGARGVSGAGADW